MLLLPGHSQLRGCFVEPLKLSKPAPVPLDEDSAPPVLGDSVTQQDPACPTSTVWPRLLLETQLTDVTGSQPSGARHLSRGRHGCSAQVRACQSLATAMTVPIPGLQVSLGSLLSTYPALETQPRTEVKLHHEPTSERFGQQEMQPQGTSGPAGHTACSRTDLTVMRPSRAQGPRYDK